jgi:hypothetical protein
MKKYLFYAAFCISIHPCIAQTPDTGILLLRKFAQNMGKETFKVTHNARPLCIQWWGLENDEARDALVVNI